MRHRRNDAPPDTVTSGPRANKRRDSRNLTGSGRRRLPPYARQLSHNPRNTLIVLTGSAAWDQARADTWFARHKLVLPYGESPVSYDWSMAARFPDCWMWALGDPEPADTIMALAAELLRYVPFVLYEGPGPLVKFEARRTAA